MGRVACETAVTTGMAMCMGEISTNCYVDIPKIVRQVIIDIGYDRAKYGFDGHTCAVMQSIDEQSSDIAMGVDEALEHKEGERFRQVHDGRGRSGNDVRLRLQRDSRAYAHAYRSCSQACKEAHRGSQNRSSALSFVPTERLRSPSSTRTASP